MKTLKEFFESDRFSAECGIEIIDLNPGNARCSMKITDKHMNAYGTVMGGAIFTLADYTFGVAANCHGMVAVTMNVLINYLKPGTGPVLYADAKEISRSRSSGVYQILVTDKNDTIIAAANGTCYFKKEHHSLPLA